MDAVIKQLLQVGGLPLAVPMIIIVLGSILVKGGFGLLRARSADRKDFLDAFKDIDTRSDLWLCVSIRHLFGQYLPTSLIRKLMVGPNPGRALLDVSDGWEFFIFDVATSQVRWRNQKHINARTRKRKVLMLNVGYFFLGCPGLFLAYWIVAGKFAQQFAVVAWVYVALAAIGAIACLIRGDRLKDASLAAEWLGLGDREVSSGAQRFQKKRKINGPPIS
ncbi:hypothetical protein [Xanthomonas bonasiae]|uniref:hypothetical protein n=1 Tax=Xanthomonas bonasiae TaxID=2810351 RepID=UPI001785464F|nr:hypothetical protein [Xanthomonas surreyensis]MBD7923728.1 hypothetical protein [Xanthomonas surreyensis]